MPGRREPGFFLTADPLFLVVLLAIGQGLFISLVRAKPAYRWVERCCITECHDKAVWVKGAVEKRISSPPGPNLIKPRRLPKRPGELQKLAGWTADQEPDAINIRGTSSLTPMGMTRLAVGTRPDLRSGVVSNPSRASGGFTSFGQEGHLSDRG